MSIFAKFYAKKNDFVTRDIGGETIIVPIRDHVGDLESIYSLNEVGTLIGTMIVSPPISRVTKSFFFA